ncbi:hypothetical protein [Enterococcus gilvus]|uniref:hypothetical protein n=1 Tax=Enterococcus gilvus TaxID=160453 RepID=UPI001C8CF04A|nr:hypothetical protein [Enterococcus gilvus]MBX8936895.1 hypothetical protein [Enterococcus gilvus]
MKDGKDVKLIKETPDKTKKPDLLVNGVKVEIKTLKGNNINTLVTKVGEALKQVKGGMQLSTIYLKQILLQNKWMK